MKELKLKQRTVKYLSIAPFLLISLVFIFGVFYSNSFKQNLDTCGQGGCQTTTIRLANGCGSMNGYVSTSINFGCMGNSCSSTGGPVPYCSKYHDGITDLLFAIIRFLSDGVGIIVVLSIIIGGIQYITSRGDPNATQSAIRRLTSALTALLVFIFAYAILNYVIPNGFFSQ